jgi:hypothetical protein
MKIVLEVEDKSYQTILDFISLLPENQCRVLPEETNKSNLPDNTKDKPFTHKYSHQVLPTGTTLLVALTIKPKPDLSEDLKIHLKSRNEFDLSYDYYKSNLSVDTQFVEITISNPIRKQKKLLEDTGGVFLQFDGLSQTGIFTTSIKLPIIEDDKDVFVDSFNYAFTRLSEKYEPWRISHTGNSYDRIFYKEKNDKWYPIDLLRNVISAKKEEHQLVFEARQEAIKRIQERLSLNKRKVY